MTMMSSMTLISGIKVSSKSTEYLCVKCGWSQSFAFKKGQRPLRRWLLDCRRCGGKRWFHPKIRPLTGDYR